MQEYSLFAAVDLGSNSFRLEVARVEGEQIYALDSLKETVRLAAGLTPDNHLDEEAQTRALDCLRRFGERLRGLDPHTVRVVGTNTLRVAVNAPAFLEQAEAALGFPIDIIAGREEARLIYLGVSRGMPPSSARTLVVDIGGGSTECIIGTGSTALRMESLHMGCVVYSNRFFADGKLSRNNLLAAEVTARGEVQKIAREFRFTHWQNAIGSSGTARALADILEANGLASGGTITADGLAELRGMLLRAKEIRKLDLPGLKTDRVPVLAGGFAIMASVFAELGIKQMSVATTALREGVLYDLLGRIHHHDTRDVTVRQFMQRYRVDRRQAMRVEELASAFLEQLAPSLPMDYETALQRLCWGARLHEVGLAIAHSGYHRHGAYIVGNADMPGFSKKEQQKLAMLLLGQRGALAKLQEFRPSPSDWTQVFALRLAVLLYRSRTDHKFPRIGLSSQDGGFILTLDKEWLEDNLFIATMLEQEMRIWGDAGLAFAVNAVDKPARKAS